MDDPVREYRLKTLRFGTKPAAYLAIKCIQILAEDARARSKLAAETILHYFYADYLLSVADTIEFTIEKRNVVVKELQEGCFELRKWASNEPPLAKGLPVENRETKLLLSLD